MSQKGSDPGAVLGPQQRLHVGEPHPHRRDLGSEDAPRRQPLGLSAFNIPTSLSPPIWKVKAWVDGHQGPFRLG